MEGEALQLAHFLVEKLEKIHPSARLLVGISGIPASGKSVFAQVVIDLTNKLLASTTSTTSTGSKALLIGLDGWHLRRAELDALPDPKLAHDRRGIHWTFDALGYVTFVNALREDLTANTPVITAPSFDHALKDPTYNDISVYPHHRIVIIEGLYTLLSIPPWNEASLLLNERWFIQVDVDEARRRLVGRHVLTGVTKNLEEALWRAEENDIPNGRFIISNMLEPTRVIESTHTPSFALH